MGWDRVENPSQKLLDKLLEDSRRDTCPDCGAAVGAEHHQHCDAARCSVCKMQRFSCGCRRGNGGKWDGYWPGSKECYDRKLVVTFNGGEPSFDLNTLATEQALENARREDER